MPAEFTRACQGIPSTLDERAIGLFPAGGGGYLGVVPPDSLDVTGAIERRQDSARELGGLFEDRLGHIRRRVLGPGELREELLVRQFTQYDGPHVVERRLIVVHGHAPSHVAPVFAADLVQSGVICPSEQDRTASMSTSKVLAFAITAALNRSSTSGAA